ncbi:Endoribonuclease L-PSP [Pyrenochaeta sp. DS3sAY3a]|nr:Endoribonuclease L-PSP [Pyrenochaeta sp. DS3sAY3a]
MPRTAILTPNAPAPSPHLSQAITHNGIIYTSGALGIHPTTRKLAGNAYKQTNQALQNLSAILASAHSSHKNILKATIYLSSMTYYADVNRAYLEFFEGEIKPSRTCVAVAELPLKGADVEIEVIASINEEQVNSQRNSKL